MGLKRSDSVLREVEMRVIDIFCGCGGMSWGLHKMGFDVLLGIDVNEKYIQSFTQNFGEEKTLSGDLR